MTPSRWQQIESIYNEARRREPEERAAYLVTAGADDPELVREVQALLAGERTQTTVTIAVPGNAIPTGTQIGQYRIESKVAEGGMGAVYRGLDTKLNRPVAVKFLADDFVDAAARRRFQREAQMASSLNHPHIVTVYDAGEFEGRQYLVIEFVDGGTLKDWARRERKTSEDVLELLIGVADGLATAHQAGILHRDIKPDNILLTATGYAKLADFGLAKLADGANSDLTRTLTEGRTRPGVIVGTIPYMSPEQAAGKTVDARSDIFSFGVVLYELLCGRRPFRGETDLQVLQGILHAQAEPLGSETPPSLRAVVEKALVKEPRLRYQSMREVVADLKRSLRETASVTPRPAASGSGRGVWKWAIAGAAAVAMAVGAWVIWRQKPQSTAAQQYVQLTNFADSAVSPSLSPDGRMLAFIRGEETFQGPGQVYVKLLPDGNPVQITHDGGTKEGPVVFSPSGSQIAFSNRGSTWVAPVLGGEPSQLLAGASGLSWVKTDIGRPRVMFSLGTGEGIHMGIFESAESRSESRTVYMPATVTGMAHRSFLSPILLL